MQREFPFGAHNTFSRCRLHVLLAPERPEDPRQDKQGLIIVRFDVGSALKETGRFVKLALGKAGTSIEITGFKQIGIEGDRLIKLRHRLWISLTQ